MVKKPRRQQSDEAEPRSQERKRRRAASARVRRERREPRKLARQAKLEGVFERYPAARRLYEDSFFRLITLTYPAFGIDVVYAIVYAIMGIVMASPWSGTIAAFYICLSLMRAFVLRAERAMRRDVPESEQARQAWRTHRMVGVTLAVTTIVFFGALLLLVNKQVAIHYPGYFIYAVATYTTYQVVYATIQFVRARKQGAPIASALRCIGVANMLLSLLSLQTALITAFGDPSDDFGVMMSGITGFAVCVLIALLGISMIVHANRELRRAS